MPTEPFKRFECRNEGHRLKNYDQFNEANIYRDMRLNAINHVRSLQDQGS